MLVTKLLVTKNLVTKLLVTNNPPILILIVRDTILIALLGT